VKKEVLESKEKGTVILIGFNSGDHIPFLMEMFPMLDFIFIDDHVSRDKLTNRMIEMFNFDPYSGDPEPAPSPVSGYFMERARNKEHKFFGKSFNTQFKFMSITSFMEELIAIPAAEGIRSRMKPIPLLDAIRYPSSENPPPSMKELLGSNLYLISNYRSSEHNAMSGDNELILSDLVYQLYWMKVLRPTYSFVRYKPPHGILSDEARHHLTTLNGSTSIGSYCDYPKGYFFKIPKTSKGLNSAFLITNSYDEPNRIYHENLHTLINYHNHYVKHTIMYEDLFVRLIDEKLVGMPYSSLKHSLVTSIIKDYSLIDVDIHHHQFFVSTSWDDTVAVYIIMTYLKLFDKTTEISKSLKSNHLRVPEGMTKQVVKMNQVLKIIVHSLLVLRLEERNYDKLINSFLLVTKPGHA
jgi:hypothetical protein